MASAKRRGGFLNHYKHFLRAAVLVIVSRFFIFRILKNADAWQPKITPRPPAQANAERHGNARRRVAGDVADVGDLQLWISDFIELAVALNADISIELNVVQRKIF